MTEDTKPAVKRSLDDDNDVDEKPVKRQRGDGPNVNLRLLLACKNAGAVIGKGGENIKSLRNDFGCQFQLPDNDGPERILSIKADLGTACAALVKVIPLLEEYKHNKDLDYECEIRMLVHQSQAGCIIGRQGSRIKELRNKTGTNIKVFVDCCPLSTERIVELKATPETVADCVFDIFQLLQTAPPIGADKPYDPTHYDEFYAAEYGGYTFQQSSKGGSGGGRGGSGGRGSGRGRQDNDRGSDRGNRPFGMSQGRNMDLDVNPRGMGGRGFGMNDMSYGRGGSGDFGGNFNRFSGRDSGGFGDFDEGNFGGRERPSFGGRDGGRNGGNFGGRESGSFGGRGGGTLMGSGRDSSFGGREGGNFGGRDSGAFGGRDSGAFGGREGGAYGGREGAYGSREGGAFGGREGGAFSGREGGNFAGREGGNFAGREGGAFGGREGGAFSGREGGAFGGREGGAFGGREGGAFGGREGGAFGGRESGAFGGREGGALSGREGAFSGRESGAFARRGGRDSDMGSNSFNFAGDDFSGNDSFGQNAASRFSGRGGRDSFSGGNDRSRGNFENGNGNEDGFGARQSNFGNQNGFSGGRDSQYDGFGDFGNEKSFGGNARGGMSGRGSRGGGGGGASRESGSSNFASQRGQNNDSGSGQLGNNSGNLTTTQVSIPKEMAGSIIGQRGANIREIRNDTGAEITIAEPEHGSTDRIITIKGTDEQIRLSQYLMQRCVKNNM